ncbi:o-succinylbenzoate--CoA ligase [Vibrio palustris]|uniref:2-succinylbenzoate--CoA ligase n=1 Tax=Vibrio palustris TaxID=1918946 RepID=A0A1R4B3F3_9VIBR|nr:o-succinylbenzoate--CoA ligase [Vibrio palustris]SJL83433.1 2-succinylbenzoate--CoA ligase [Vibrio palustris]
MGTNCIEIASLPTQPLWHHWRINAPMRVALYAEGKRYTWHELCETVDCTSYQLYQQGVRASDVVTMVGKNHPHMLWILLAAHQLGASCALTMPQPSELLERKLKTLYPDDKNGFLWLSPTLDKPLATEMMHGNRPLLHVSPEAMTPSYIPDVQYAAPQLASLLFTSGSTGHPKAVAHNHLHHFASAMGLLQRLQYAPGDCWLLSLPLYHVSGLSIIYRWLTAGACLKIGQGQLADDIEGVTHASLVPFQLQQLFASKRSLSLSHVLLGGSHIPQSLGLRAAALGIDTWLGYGMTEAASTITARRVQEGNGVGRVLPYRELRIQDQRIFLRGQTLASGYYHQGELTPLFDKSGWFDTQDLGDWQSTDDLVIVGRADNQFISGGENIHCEEIEAVLNQHHAVQSAIVVPVADKRYGARPVAIVKTTHDVTQVDWNVWCQGKLEKYKWPVAYYAMPGHLEAGAIKLPRRALRDWLLQCHVS